MEVLMRSYVKVKYRGCRHVYALGGIEAKMYGGVEACSRVAFMFNSCFRVLLCLDFSFYSQMIVLVEVCVWGRQVRQR
jgi:hypothetical protein